MPKHWRERMKDKKTELCDEKSDHIFTVGVISILIVGFILTWYISYTIGFARGEKECNDAKAGIEQMYFKAWALTSEASRVLSINKDTVKNCREIGQHIVDGGQRIH